MKLPCLSVSRRAQRDTEPLIRRHSLAHVRNSPLALRPSPRLPCSPSPPLPRSLPHMPISDAHPLVRGQLLEAHRPAGVQPLRGDGHLGAEPELAAVGEARAGVDVHRGRSRPRRRSAPRCASFVRMPSECSVLCASMCAMASSSVSTTLRPRISASHSVSKSSGPAGTTCAAPSSLQDAQARRVSARSSTPPRPAARPSRAGTVAPPTDAPAPYPARCTRSAAALWRCR